MTQSIAISPQITLWLYRRSDPHETLLSHGNFDRFHRTCLLGCFQDVGGNNLGRGCHPCTTEYPLSLCHHHHESRSNIQPARQYQSILLIQDSLDMVAFSFSTALYSRFYMPPDSCESTSACLSATTRVAHTLVTDTLILQ